ncbi:MAG: prephenate dehydrogenase/arogenate dehydrogenase family protein [Oceanospirillales bacterium]|nr:MAG: prephenate dehydrogenase/arogenate dehydrogenase family protein [Oceanospirillales bacterium]
MIQKLDRVLVVGLGLIGGSFASGIKSRSLANTVVGYDINEQECQLGVELNVIDEYNTDLRSAAAEADLIMLAVPVKATESLLAEIFKVIKPTAIISDVGSTKMSIIEAANRVFGALPHNFVPGHPIAGAEKSGVTAANHDLFERHKVILTPLQTTPVDAVKIVASLWEALGADVLEMSPERHDEVLAATSHLPHILAFSLVDTLAHEEQNKDIFRYAAGGFRDFTRIAASDPVMWHDICHANRDAILDQIDQFTDGLTRLRAAIDQGDSQTLLGIFTRARVAREYFSTLLTGTAYELKPVVQKEAKILQKKEAG